MTNCMLSLLRAIWSFIVGSLRIILFFGCLLFVICQFVSLCILFKVSTNEDFFHFPGATIGIGEYMWMLALLSLALLGCYGSFYKHHPSIKAFSILTGLSAMFLIIMILFAMTPEALNKEADEILDELKNKMKRYDWNREHQDEEAYRVATKNWDAMQRLYCCGIKGPEDWAKYRPRTVSSHLYPKTCCIHPDPSDSQGGAAYCSKDSPYMANTGCEERLQQVGMISLLIYGLFIMFQFILCLISYVVGFCGLRSANIPDPRAGESGRSFLPSQQYERFDRSVYVRQPPVNQQHQTTNEKPQLYPNVQDIEKNIPYSSPPPSYGTSS